MTPAVALIAYVLADIERFSRLTLGRPLYDYQLAPLRAIVESVLRQRGDEYLLLFPRQSGKNEAIAHLLVYLLNLFQRRGGQIVYGATGDGLGRGIRRLEECLDNPWNRGRWQSEARPARRRLGRAAVVFLSTHPKAASRGETAHHLLVIDEAQDQIGAHIEAVFTPMRAAGNATAVYLGTARLTGDFLWQKKQELEGLTAADGRQRVFIAHPEQVTAENPSYGRFLAEQVRRYGRSHPIVAAEYYLEPVDGAGGLFPPWRRALMRGRHTRQHSPEPGKVYIAAVDVAGQDEATVGTTLHNPTRDYTVATVFEVVDRPDDDPVYLVVDIFVDHGSRHFQDAPGRPKLADRLLAYLQHWDVAHAIIDASGVGQGLADWLAARLGPDKLTAHQFAGRAAKARLGSNFLALVETGRFAYWTGDEDQPLSDGWWFRRQVEACAYHLPAGGRFDRDLQWGVAAQTRLDTPAGPQPVHDDRLLSAALVAELDWQARQGRLVIGGGHSKVRSTPDPFARLGH